MTVARRAGQYALVLWAAVTLNFALPYLAPGDPVEYLYGGDQQSLDPKYIAQMRADYGLDRPIFEQYLSFWSGLLHGDLGMSVQHNRPVVDVLWEKLPWTLALVGIGTLLAFVIGTLLGTWAAWRRGTAKETATVVGVLTVDSMPGFFVGMILIAVFSVNLGWFPSYGAAAITSTGGEWLLEVASRMVLPVATLTIAGIGGFFLMTRASMVGVLDEPSSGSPARRVSASSGLRSGTRCATRCSPSTPP